MSVVTSMAPNPINLHGRVPESTISGPEASFVSGAAVDFLFCRIARGPHTHGVGPSGSTLTYDIMSLAGRARSKKQIYIV